MCVFVCELISLCVWWTFTELVGLSEAREGGVESGTLLFVGTKLLQQLTHLLLTQIQQALQGHLTWAHLLQNTHIHTCKNHDTDTLTHTHRCTYIMTVSY